MRRAVVLVALAACELQPAPKKQPAPVEVATQPPPPPPQLPQQPGEATRDAGAFAQQVIQASAPCINVAAHVVQVFIDTAKDPAQAAVYEQERMQMTKATAEACERQQWSEAAQGCYMASKDPPAIKACENKFPPSPPSRETGPGTGAAGSAAPVQREPGRDTGAGLPKGSAAPH